MLVIMAYQYSRSRARRKARANGISSHRPTRQLTVRSGKVIPLAQAMQINEMGFDSPGLSSLGSGKSTHGSLAPEVQTPGRIHEGNVRRFSAIVDPEAQMHPYEGLSANDKALRTLGAQHLKPLKPPRKRGTGDTRKASITESLLKAYQGPPIPGSEPIELPASPLSRPLITRKTSMKKPAESTIPEASVLPRQPLRSKSVGRSKTSCDQKVRFQQCNMETRRKSEGGRPSRLRRVTTSEGVPPFQLAEVAQLPTPPFIGTPDNFRNSVVEASEDFRTSLEIYDQAPQSFFSNSPSSSVVSSPIAPLSTGVSPLTASAPAFSPLTPSSDNFPSPLGRGIPVNPSPPQEKEKETSGSPKYKQKRPPDIDTTSYLSRPYEPHSDSSIAFNEASSTTKTPTRPVSRTPTTGRTPKEIRDLHRGPSVMSNRSDVTFAASDVSTNWTFGNARQMSIVPGVAPQQLSMPPVQRPKSKYRRKRRVERMDKDAKRLPILPPMSG